jgi:hypothetical protein
VATPNGASGSFKKEKVVTGGEDEQMKGKGKGFAGLSSLVSDVDTTLPPAAKTELAASAPSTERPAPQAAQPQPSQQHQTYQEPAQPSSSGSSGGKWVLGIAAVIGVLWLIGQSDKSPTSPAPAYSPPAQTATPIYSSSAEPQARSRPQESMPPVGRDLVLSTAQISYCLAEDIRMEGAKSALNNYIDSDVDRFNAMVADYNSRCGSFRYRSGALEGARREIEPYRSQLQTEGSDRFARPTTDSLSAPTPSFATLPPASSSSSDGSGANDSIAQIAPPGPATNATSPSSNPPSPSGQRPGLPANAFVMGSSWYCKEGFRKVGDECEALVVPQNAFVMGSSWYCKEGFRKVGDECEALVVPQNAFVMGSSWYCKEGFRKVGDQCEALVVPQNAFVMGSSWYCKEGFRKVGDQCVSVFER